MSYPETYYASTAINAAPRPTLNDDVSVDVCIVGAGIAGLSCALELLEQGKSVAIVEREAVAWGASGRNGGLVSPGWAQGNDALEKKLGLSHAQQLFELSVQGVEQIKANIERFALAGCQLKTGRLSVSRYRKKQIIIDRQRTMLDKYQYPQDYLDTDQVRQICRTQRYFDGLYDANSFHFHPLNYCLGLASVIEQKGGLIYEQSAVVNISTDKNKLLVGVAQSSAKVSCEDVVFCGGGYSGKEIQALQRSYLPIATYMLLTQPLGDLAAQLISRPYSISDDRRAADYYRVVEGDRLLWGSRITTDNQDNVGKLSSLLREDLCSVYPQLQEVKIDKAWSGLMAYAGHKMPIVQQQQPGVWICSSFGGHGLNTGTICGVKVAQGICAINQDYQLLSPFGCDWNGGILGPMVANLTYKYLRLKDKIQESAI